MYERMILTDDGSPLARAAVPRAAALAVASGSEVLVVRVSATAGMRPDDLDGDDWGRYLSDEAAAQAAASPLEAEPHLSQVVTDLRARGVRRVSSLLIHGEPADALVEATDKLHADLIVMSTHGLSGIRRAVLGSVADHVIRHAREVPVLLCPPLVDGPEAGIRRVLLTFDGSDLSRIAIPHAEHVARSLDTGLTLLQVTDSVERMLTASSVPVGSPPQPSIPIEVAQRIAGEGQATAGAALRALAVSLREGGVRQVDVEVAAGEPAEEILAAVDRLGVDVVVMATHGRGGLGRLLIGSVADTVARHSGRAAVLLVRTSEKG